ncbi:MAG TPA: MraY family glycosyltransferase [Mycobacteriales bacterium]|nr:MraY family glycosyltransferase [Mycobacteriales bacterium]
MATYLLTPLVRVIAIRLRVMAPVRDRDVHTVPIPRLGGLAILGGLFAGTVVARQIPVLSETFGNSSEPRAAIVAAFLITLLGVVDDKWELDALTKLAGQICAAGVMVLMGVQLSYLNLPGHVYVLGRDTAVPLTVLLVVLLVNAINFIDGLDGLAAGVVGIAAAATFAYSYHLQSSLGEGISAAPASLMAALLLGACLGFLPHNFSPARVFMGDSGSMPIGLMLAASMTSVTGQVDYAGLSQLDQVPLLVPLVVPLAVIAIPFVDMVLAVMRRARAGRSPFSPDKMHLHHRLLEIGHSHRRAVLLMYAWAALLGFGGVILSFSDGGAVAIGGLAVVFVAIVAVSGLPRLRALRQR